VLAAIGALAALTTDCTIEVERVRRSESQVQGSKNPTSER
jgi:hypothetical protein